MSSTGIWSKFTRNVDGKEVKFQIQEVGPNHYEEVLKLFLDYYAPEEIVHKMSELSKSDEAVKEYIKHYIGHGLSEHCQIDACFAEDESNQPKIVAGSIMYVDKKGDAKWDGQEILKLLKTEQMKSFFKMVNYMVDMYNKDFRDNLNLDVLFDDVGIVVHNDYRGLGIAGEIFKARMVTCKEKGVPMAGAWMTSIGAQKAASKLNWETVMELNYVDIAKIGGVTYKGTLPSAKYMIKKV